MRFRNIISCSICSLLAIAGSAQAAEIVNIDFETAPAITVHTQAGDATANLQYDYSTYVPASGTDGPTSIGAAPSGAGTKGARLEANNGDANAAPDSVALFPTAAAGLSEYTLKFDMWMQWNGDTAGGAGSSEFITFGGNADGDGGEAPDFTSSANAVCYAMCGEGGFALDYRYSQGGVANNALANWNGANETNHTGAGWQALFASPAHFKPGCPGRAWVVVELDVKPTELNVYVTPNGGTRTLVSTLTPATTLTTGSPFVGYADVNTSISGVPADNFAVIDNLVVTTPDANVINWSVY